MKGMKLASMPTIKRLPSYLHIVEAAGRDGLEYISGTLIAEELGLESIQVRKDLAVTGIMGRPRLGFPVGDLIESINTFLDWNRIHPAFLIGTGNLGTALLGYGEFTRHGMSIVAAFDCDTGKTGKTVNGIPVYFIDDLHRQAQEQKPDLAILTVPSSSAQEISDTLVSAGIKAIWNFTNTKIKVPADVTVEKEDLSSGYAVLSVRMRQAHANR